MNEKDNELNIEVTITVKLENDELEDEFENDGLDFLEDDDEWFDELLEDDVDQAVQVTTNVFMSTW